MKAKATSASTPMAQKVLYLSHFTPSMMSAETLQAMLVQRQPLLDTCFDDVVHSATTTAKHHYLFVGPRGIGKTHLISLLHHRLEQTPAVQRKALIAWMREEEWGVTSFFELVLRILRTLDQSYPDMGIQKQTDSLYELPLRHAEGSATSLLLKALGKKTLIILMENLDDLFEQMGDVGQRQWRAFIQNHPQVVIVATTPSLFSGVSLQKSPFYGFFDIQALKDFEFDDVVTLLEKIATERGDPRLVKFIQSPEGRARVRAIHHLAEGNPRIYVIFAQFLSQEALDELVQAFMHTLDELTPYYQARMKELSGQQRKIVEYLVNYRGAAPVKQIAKSCFITHQTCSGQLKQLRDKRYVRSIEQGRESYYELSEPLMRLCMDVKKQRGEPISLFVDILRIWYTEDELLSWLPSPGQVRKIDARYITKALAATQGQHLDPKLLAQITDLRQFARSKDKSRVQELIGEVAATRPSNETSAHLQSIVLLTLQSIPALRGGVALNLDTIAQAFGTGVAQWSTRLTRLTAQDIYLGLLRASLGLYGLDEDRGRQSLHAIVGLLAEFPAQAFVAALHCGKGAEPAVFVKWLGAVFDQLPDTVAPANWGRFMRVATRMSNAYSKWLDAKDSRHFLELPSEERKLMFALTDGSMTKS